MAVPPRTGHIAVCADRYLLVWGGYQEVTDHASGESYLPADELWLYDIDTHAWRVASLTGITLNGQQQSAFPLGTSGATANVHKGILFVFGGHTQYGHSNYLLKLDLATCEWDVYLGDPESPRPSPRDKLTSWVYKDKLYYFGGYGSPLLGFLRENGEFLPDDSSSNMAIFRGWNNQLLTLDLSSGKWSNPKCRGAVPVPRAAHAATRVGNHVYLFGGRHGNQRLGDLHRLDLDTLTWSGEIAVTGQRPVGRSWHSLVTVSPPMLFLYGGYTTDNRPLADAWTLNVNVLQWTEIHLNTDRPRLWHTCCVSWDKDILIFGGCSNDILNDDTPVSHCGDVLEFRLAPKSLLRLCVDAVFENRLRTERHWQDLPRHLLGLLKRRLEAWRFSQRSDVITIPPVDKTNIGQVCLIS